MGLFDKKPKKKDSFLGGNYEPDAWRKHIPYNDTHDSHIWDWGAKDKDGDGYRRLPQQMSEYSCLGTTSKSHSG